MIRLAMRLLATRLRQGRMSSLVVIVVLATAGAAGTGAVLVREAVTGPWDRAFDATHGAHLHVARFGEVDASALARLPGVVESSSPVVSTIRELRSGAQAAGVALAGIPGDLRIDRPLVVEGAWRPGAIVVERSFARALGIGAGDEVQVDGQTLAVSGIAVSVRTAGYPASVPGSAFTDLATAAGLGGGGQRLTTVGLRLADPAGALEVALAASRYGMVTAASAVRADALDRTRQFEVVLGSFSILLLGAAGFLIVVLLGARLRAQSRELAVLRLIGLTPAQLVGLIGAEHALLAGLGSVLGAAVALAGGRRLAEAAAGALGSISPRPGPSVVALIVAIVGVAAAVAAVAARRPATAGLAAPARVRVSSAGARLLAAGLPAPVALAAKEVLSNRARAVAGVAAVALAVMTAVAALGMEATFRHDREEARARSIAAPVEAPVEAPGAADESGLRTLVYGLQGLLAAVALAAIVAVGLVGIRERRRELAVLSAIGFSVRQLAGSTVAGQAALAGLGAVVGIPLGLGFFRLAYALANGSGAGLVDAPLPHLIAVVPLTVAMAGAVAALPAASLRRLPVAAALSPT